MAAEASLTQKGWFTGRHISSLIPVIDSIKREKIDGVLIPKLSDSSLAQQLKNVKDLDIRGDDVITVGFSRSGNHWAFEIMHMIQHKTTKFRTENLFQCLLESRPLENNIHDDLRAEPSPRNLATHLKSGGLPKQILSKRTKIVYLLRNPKDVLNSSYKQWSRLTIPGVAFQGSWEEFLDLSIADEFPYGSWFSHVLDFEAFMQDHPEVPVYIHLYEDMIQDPVQSVKNLCRFLDCEDSDIAEEIVETTQFDHMKANAKKLKEMEEYVFDGKYSLLRKGCIGDWRNAFTVKQSEIFNQLFEEKMGNSKLGALVRPFI